MGFGIIYDMSVSGTILCRMVRPPKSIIIRNRSLISVEQLTDEILKLKNGEIEYSTRLMKYFCGYEVKVYLADKWVGQSVIPIKPEFLIAAMLSKCKKVIIPKKNPYKMIYMFLNDMVATEVEFTQD